MQAGSAAFDSDAEATPFLDTNETIADICYEAEIFGPSQLDTPWPLFPFLVQVLGAITDDVPVIGIFLAPFARVSAGPRRTALDSDRYELVFFFNRCYLLVDASLTLCQSLLSSLSAGARKRIYQIVMVGGGASLRLLLQVAPASKHFWTKKLLICSDFPSFLKTISVFEGVSAPPLAALLDEGVLPEKWDPVGLPISKVSQRTGVQIEAQNVPYHLAQMIFLMRCATLVKSSGSAFPDAADIYAFIGQLQTGEPVVEPPDAATMVVGMRAILHQFGNLLGEDSWDVIRQSLEDDYDGNYEIILYFIPLVPELNRLLIHGILMWCSQWLSSASAVANYDSPEQYLADLLTPLFSRPDKITSDCVPVCRYANECILSTMENLEFFISSMTTEEGEEEPA